MKKKTVMLLAMVVLSRMTSVYGGSGNEVNVGEADSHLKVTSSKEDQRATKSASAAVDKSGRTVHLQMASKIVGSSLKSKNEHEIGKVEDIRLDVGKSRIIYFVVSKKTTGGDARRVAVPPEALEFTPGGMILRVNEQMLDRAPRENQEDEKAFQQKLQRHYGIAPAGQ